MHEGDLILPDRLSNHRRNRKKTMTPHDLTAAPLTNSVPGLGPLALIVNVVEIVTKFLETKRKPPNRHTLKSRSRRAKIDEGNEFVGRLWLSDSDVAEIDLDITTARETPKTDEQWVKARLDKVVAIVGEWSQRHRK